MKAIMYWLLCLIEVLTLIFLAGLIWSLMHCDSLACALSTAEVNWDNWFVLVWGSVPIVAIAIFHTVVTHRLTRSGDNKPDGRVAMMGTQSQKWRKWSMARESAGLLTWIAYIGIALALLGVALFLPGLSYRSMEFLISPALMIHLAGPACWLFGIVLYPIAMFLTDSDDRVRRGLWLCANYLARYIAVLITLAFIAVFTSGR